MSLRQFETKVSVETAQGLLLKLAKQQKQIQELERKLSSRPWRDFFNKGPKIICICGSSRFVDIAAVAAWNFEKQGAIALSMCLLPEWYGRETGKTEHHHYAEQENVAEILDELHLRKIDLADSVFIVNKDGYIGDRTRKEIEYAQSLGKPITYMEQK